MFLEEKTFITDCDIKNKNWSVMKIFTKILLMSLFFSFCATSIAVANDNFDITKTDQEEISEKDWQSLQKTYKQVTKEKNIILALEMLKNSSGAYSRDAILGANLTNKPIKVQFKDLAEINPNFQNFDAAGSILKQKLYININEKHKNAPPIALAALLSHEALHQDSFNSINEETYAWTMEAAVWTQLSERYPEKVDPNYPLIKREETLKKLFIKGNYTDEYIRKSIKINPAYQNLPSRSPGFEDRL